MIRQYSKIIGTQVLSHAEGAVLAVVEDLIVHPDTGKVEGFWVKPLTLPFRHAVLPWEAVVAWKQHLYVKNEQAMAEPDEVIRIADILARKTYFVGSRVETESGKSLGAVFDLDLDDRKMTLRYLFVQRSFLFFHSEPRFVHGDSIVQVLPGRIVVKDDDKKSAKEAGPVADRLPALEA
jgi:sporulation protein YlmC with PRC-barrel domain